MPEPLDTLHDRTPRPLLAGHAFAVTPDDDVDLAFLSMVLVAGEPPLGKSVSLVCVVTIDGDEAVVPMAPGVPLPLRVRRVKATGTNCATLVALA